MSTTEDKRELLFAAFEDSTMAAVAAKALREWERQVESITLGNLAVGAIGAGASVAVLNVSGQVTAKAGGKLRAGETIDVDAKFVQDVDVLSIALQGGFIGLGASVVVINDTSAVRALILDNSAVDGAATVTVSASGD